MLLLLTQTIPQIEQQTTRAFANSIPQGLYKINVKERFVTLGFVLLHPPMLADGTEQS